MNTDFAQVEVDDQQVNLDRFTLFFPEKRPFFLENAGFFTVGNPGEVDLFFSRRIGISDAGAGDSDPRRRPRLGQGRQVQRRRAQHADRRLRGSRAEHQLQRRRASAATCPTDRRSARSSPTARASEISRPARDPGRTYGVDGKWGIGPTTMITGFPGEDRHRGRDRERPCLQPSLANQPAAVGPQPRLPGSRQRLRSADRLPEPARLSQARCELMTRFRPKDFIGIQELRPHATFRGFWGLDGFQETGYMHLDNHWQFRDSTEIHTGMNLTREGVRTPFEIYPGVFVPPGTYDHAEAQLVAMSNQGAPLSVQHARDHRRLLRRRSGDAQPDAPDAGGRQAHDGADLSAQRHRLAVGPVRHQPGAHARVILVLRRASSPRRWCNTTTAPTCGR